MEVMYIATEYCEQWELFEYVFYSEPMSESTIRYFFRQICDTVNYMHQCSISHRDLKVENILLDRTFTLKISDLGHASFMDLDVERVGTEIYCAPEILNCEHHCGKKADVFACGVILFLFMAKDYPFEMKATSTDRYYSYIA